MQKKMSLNTHSREAKIVLLVSDSYKNQRVEFRSRPEKHDVPILGLSTGIVLQFTVYFNRGTVLNFDLIAKEIVGAISYT